MKRKNLLDTVEMLEEEARNLTGIGWSEDMVFEDTDDMTNEELEEYIEKLKSYIDEQEIAFMEEMDE